MAGLDPAIQFPAKALRFRLWMAAHVLGLDPGIKGGHDEEGGATAQTGYGLFALESR
jgi:hypothetical protein